MAFVINDRVKETTTTTGTGTLDLGGAQTGFETFVAGIGNSNTTYYCITLAGSNDFEVGLGTVTDASTDTLSRDTILSSSNGDAAVNFGAGIKTVFCTLPAAKAIVEDGSNNISVGNNITVGGTVDGVDIASRDTVLTNTTTTANAALPKAGGTMTGNITFNAGQATGNSGLVPAAGTSGHFLAHNGAFSQVAYGDVSGTPSVPGGATGLDLNDDVKARFGTGNDLEIYHDGNDSYIKDSAGTGDLFIQTNKLEIVKANALDRMATFTGDGSVELRYDDAIVFTTSTDGVDMPDNKKLQIGDGDDLQLFHDTTNSQIINNTGALKFRSDSYYIRSKDDAKNSIVATPAGAVDIYYDNALKFSTTTNGVQVAADQRLEIVNGANWSGELVGKIEQHSNNMYHQYNSNFITRNSSGTNTLTIDSSGNGTFNANVTAYSDVRIKEDIKTIDNALDKVSKLRGVEYTRKETKAREIGVIAQEVKEIVPELVNIENTKSDINPDAIEDMHTMKYGNTVGLLIEAIKELKAEIEELKKVK